MPQGDDMNPMDDLTKLRDAIDRVASQLHIKRESWGVVPAEKDMPDHIVVTFSIDPEIVLSEQERQQRLTDELFASIAENFNGEKEDPELRRMLDEAKSMMEDDDWEDLD
jgi:hypothetical protein